MKKKWYKRKTTWTGLSGIFAAVGGFFSGLDPASALQLAITSLAAIFMRSAIENK